MPTNNEDWRVKLRIGNLIVIVVITFHNKMRTFLNFFLANLAAADLCVGIFCVLPNLSLYISQQWLIGMVMCKLFYFVQSLNYTCSISILTIISLERFLAITHPMTCRRLSSRSRLSRVLRFAAVACVWTASVAYSTPLLFVYSTFALPTGDVYCVRALPSGHTRMTTIYVMVDLFLFYLLPLLLMLVVYTKIAVVLWRSSSAAATGSDQQHPNWTECSIGLEAPGSRSFQGGEGGGLRRNHRRSSVFSRANETLLRPGGQSTMTMARRGTTSSTPLLIIAEVELKNVSTEEKLTNMQRPKFFREKSESNPELRLDSIDGKTIPRKDSSAGGGVAASIGGQRPDQSIPRIFGGDSRNSLTSALTASSRGLLNVSSPALDLDSRTKPGLGRTHLSNGVTAKQHPCDPSSRLSPSPLNKPPGSAESLPGARRSFPSPVKTRVPSASSLSPTAIAAAVIASTAAGRLSMGGQGQGRPSPLVHRRRVIRLLIVMVAAFGVCMLPHHVRLQWQEWSDVGEYTQQLMYVPPITTLLFYFNSCLNPFLYALISYKFRMSLAEMRHSASAARKRLTLDRGRR